MDEEKVRILKIRSESGTEDVHYPFMYKDLPDEAKLYAEQKLNETEENKEKGLKSLKEFTKSEGLAYPDDNLLIMVLRNCKYDIPKSELKLKKVLRTRQLIINKISEMDMETIQTILDECYFVIFPWRDKNGSLIWYTRQSGSADKYETDDYVFCGLALGLFTMQFPLSSIYGGAGIGDHKSDEYNHFFIVNAFRKTIPLLRGLPLRYTRLDGINEHYFAHWCLKVLSPFLSEKVKKRIMFHGSDLESLHKFYHPDILPEHLGGNLGPISNKHYREDFLKFIQRLKEENLDSTDL